MSSFTAVSYTHLPVIQGGMAWVATHELASAVSNAGGLGIICIDDIQTLITCTGVDEFVNHRFSINKIFYVHEGQVRNEN